MIWFSQTGFSFSVSGLTLVILFALLAIFGLLALRYRNIRSFEFQIFIFITVYLVGEIFEHYKIPFLSTLSPYLGSQIHLISAAFLAMVLWLRLYSVRKSGRTTIDRLETMGIGSDDQGSSGNVV